MATKLEVAQLVLTAVSVAAAVIASIAAWRTDKAAALMRAEQKGDEKLVPGVLHTPALGHPDHENCVVVTTLFNRSSRKATIHKVAALDGQGAEIDVAWGEKIDQYGNVVDRGAQLIGITDSVQLCVRRRDGLAFRALTLQVWHSFGDEPLTLHYSIAPGWQAFFAK